GSSPARLRRLEMRQHANGPFLGPIEMGGLGTEKEVQPWTSTAYPTSLLPWQTTKAGAFMEPCGCNRWQSVANPAASRTAETRENRCRGLPAVARGVPWQGGGLRLESGRGLLRGR